MILPTQLKHAWEMICLLVRLHLGDSLGLHAVVRPENIPVLVVTRLARSQKRLVVERGLYFIQLLEGETVVEDVLGDEADHEVL